MTAALLANGADIEVADRYGNTALWAALFRSDDGATIRLLLHAGADPDHFNHAGRSPRTLADTVTNIDLKQYFT